jgi:hypothetical protein
MKITTEAGRWDGGKEDNGNGQRIKKKVDGQKKGKRKESTKGNKRNKVRKGGEGRSKSIILERSGIKKKRGRILGLRTTIPGSGTGGDLGGGTELGKNRKDATERIQMGRTMSKKRKKKRKSCRGNNNRGEVGN